MVINVCLRMLGVLPPCPLYRNVVIFKRKNLYHCRYDESITAPAHKVLNKTWLFAYLARLEHRGHQRPDTGNLKISPEDGRMQAYSPLRRTAAGRLFTWLS
jgi:hypothetical protein